MGSDYYQQQDGVRNIAHALQDLGWKTWGYRADKSDSMTDYYCPASWDGVATHDDHPGVVVCVDVGSWRADKSGHTETIRGSKPGATCERCGGDGIDPSGWTLTTARENPLEYNRDPSIRPAGSVALFPHVVSPIPFRDEDGCLKCKACGGRGHDLIMTETAGDTWPEFQANPARSKWHVEKGGRIVAKGVGLTTARNAEGCARIMARILAAVGRASSGSNPKPRAPKAPASDDDSGGSGPEGASLSDGTRPGYVEVRFPEKPSAEMRSALKSAGFRWTRRFGCWYGLRADLPASLSPAVEPEKPETPRRAVVVPQVAALPGMTALGMREE